MPDEMTATIICTDLEQETVSAMTSALQDAGFNTIKVLNRVPPLQQTSESAPSEFRLPPELADSRFILLDEFIGGRSAFELHSFLKAAPESKDIAYCILLQSPPDTTIFAAWVAGFDLCMRKEELDMEEFSRFCRRILSGLKEENPSDESLDSAAAQ
jgi:hypothetical protein